MLGLMLLAIGCKTDKPISPSAPPAPKSDRANLEEGIERFLKKVAPPLSPDDQVGARHQGDPRFMRDSESWKLKKEEIRKFDRLHPKAEHRVQISGAVRTYGGRSPEVLKLVQIYAWRDGYGADPFKDAKSGNRNLTIEEAKHFLDAIDRLVKVQSQATRGSANGLNYSQDLGFGLLVSGYLWVGDTNKDSGSLSTNLHVGDAIIELSSADWMELKLKIEAAMKWLETQNGDLNLVTDAPPTSDKK